MNDQERKAMEMALEYLRDNQHYIADNERHAYVMEYNAFVERLEALADHVPDATKMIEQPAQQEPVAWMYVNEDGECEQIEYGPVFDDPGVTPLYTAPPKREWVGLTDEEIMDRWPCETRIEFARWIEAKLKEKNT